MNKNNWISLAVISGNPRCEIVVESNGSIVKPEVEKCDHTAEEHVDLTAKALARLGASHA